jgi:hypothetical protein
MSMRKLVVAGKDFEWVVGKSFIRIRGNKHVADIRLVDFLKDELNVPAAQAWEMSSGSGRYRNFGIEPKDVVNYIEKHGWS